MASTQTALVASKIFKPVDMLNTLSGFFLKEIKFILYRQLNACLTPPNGIVF